MSASFEARSRSETLTSADILAELERTRPLSVVMAEKIDALRDWASERAVYADESTDDPAATRLGGTRCNAVRATRRAADMSPVNATRRLCHSRNRGVDEIRTFRESSAQVRFAWPPRVLCAVGLKAGGERSRLAGRLRSPTP